MFSLFIAFFLGATSALGALVLYDEARQMVSQKRIERKRTIERELEAAGWQRPWRPFEERRPDLAPWGEV